MEDAAWTGTGQIRKHSCCVPLTGHVMDRTQRSTVISQWALITLVTYLTGMQIRHVRTRMTLKKLFLLQ